MPPVQLYGAGNPQATQLSTFTINGINMTAPMSPPESAREEFKITGDVHQLIPYAEVIGNDEQGNHFQEYADSNGYMPPALSCGTSNPQEVQLSNSAANQVSMTAATLLPESVQEEFKIVGDSNEPIPYAEVIGNDGSGDHFQVYADINGDIELNGAPGNWQFTVYAQGYAPGYFTATINQGFEDNAYDVLRLQKMFSQGAPNEAQVGNELPTTNGTSHLVIGNWLCEQQANNQNPDDYMNSGI